MTNSKRAFDMVSAGIGLIAVSPILVGIALVVKLDGGPAFYRQERVGRGGRPFRMWKFRTMVPNADRLGPQLTVAGDRRITRVGRWLRRSKLDELPQLLNVLVGEMSLVGPRPEVARYVARYTAAQRRVLALRPGITDPASIRYRDEERELAEASDPEAHYVAHVMPEKIRLNLDYAARANVLRDVGVILATFRAVLPGATHAGRSATQRLTAS
jgi:lipopolysaccharide/colanic/teichoic acid biosynthesis glycosyltransferase